MSIERVRDAADAMSSALGGVVRGQSTAIGNLVTALLAGGHVLLEGPPGIGKTLLVRAVAGLMDADYRRIQFTPDLMPADITGTSVFRPAEGVFEFVPGPLFTDVLLADEINRTPPKTQAALLEAMQERQVTLDGKTHRLSRSFFVAATQNPIEFEGTYPLPEAQLDRFFMKISLHYPGEDAERDILDVHADSLELVPAGADSLRPVLQADDLLAIRDIVAKVFVDDAVRDYILRLVRSSREHRRVTLGGSSRAAVLLLFASKAEAARGGRDFVRPDDVKGVAAAVLRHRLVLRPEAEVEGVRPDDVVGDLLRTVEVPRGETDP